MSLIPQSCDRRQAGCVVMVGMGCLLLHVGIGFADTFSPERFGIGATLVKADSISPVVVHNCTKGGPADRAGLLPGDTLAELDGRSVLSWPLKQVLDYLIRNKPLPLRVTVQRGGASLSVELVRARISDIAAGVGLRYEPTADSTNYRAVPLNERPAAAIGEVVSPTGLHNRECHETRFESSGSEYTLIYFWASWCGPCKILMKEMAKDPADPSRVRIVGINVDAACETFQAAADSLHPSGEQFWAGGWYGDLAQLLRVHRSGIPTGALLDREGRLLEVSVGVNSVLSMLRTSQPAPGKDH
jgi:thiol-disulfide isomerase/thioredoxin